MTGTVVVLLLGAAAWILWWPSAYSAAGQCAGDSSEAWRDNHGVDNHCPGAAGEDRGVSDPALMLDLVAAMLVSGRPLSFGLHILSESAEPQLARILARVVTALELGTDWQSGWELVLGNRGRLDDGTPRAEPPQVRAAAGVLRDALAFAATSGAPSAAVLHAQAEQIRRRRAREAERRAAALGIHLVLPLGLCALPAFICLSVVPLLLALLPSL